MELAPGEMLGPYRLVNQAGTGGMAEVWRAYQPRLERFVAIKVLPRHFATLPGFIDRFRQEAVTISRLQHPHILSVFDYGEQDRFTYMVSPYIGGGTLAQQLGRPCSVGEVRRVLEPLASALDYAHAQGVVHRDVKPSNALLTEHGWIVLSDFGVAKILEASTLLTQSGSVIGTPAYMSPEQASGEPATAASDLYSLGVVLYEMLTGRLPFQAETPVAIALAHLHKPLPPPRSINPDLPESLEAVLFKALAKAPGDRYQDGVSMMRALASAGLSTLGGRVTLPTAADTTAPRWSGLGWDGTGTKTVYAAGRRWKVPLVSVAAFGLGALGFVGLPALQPVVGGASSLTSAPTPAPPPPTGELTGSNKPPTPTGSGQAR